MNTGSKYTVRVRARSVVGAGQWSAVQTIGKELYACTDIIHACHYTAQLHVVFIGLFLTMQLSTPAQRSASVSSHIQFVCVALAGVGSYFAAMTAQWDIL